MSAKEMFEALGYTYHIDCIEIYEYEYTQRTIECSKMVEVNGKTHLLNIIFFVDSGHYHTEEIVDVALHQAIHQQMKELGWLK